MTFQPGDPIQLIIGKPSLSKKIKYYLEGLLTGLNGKGIKELTTFNKCKIRIPAGVSLVPVENLVDGFI